MQTNLLGKWAQHQRLKHRKGVIVAVCSSSGHLYLYIHEDGGTLCCISFDGVIVYDHRPDQEGPYR